LFSLVLAALFSKADTKVSLFFNITMRARDFFYKNCAFLLNFVKNGGGKVNDNRYISHTEIAESAEIKENPENPF